MLPLVSLTSTCTVSVVPAESVTLHAIVVCGLATRTILTGAHAAETSTPTVWSYCIVTKVWTFSTSRTATWRTVRYPGSRLVWVTVIGTGSLPTVAVHSNSSPDFFLMSAGHFVDPIGAPAKSFRSGGRIDFSTSVPSSGLEPLLHVAAASTVHASTEATRRDPRTAAG